MPHSAVGVDALWCGDDLHDGEVDIVSVADAGSDATEPSKRTVDL
jgi:hypothetical protein